MLFNLSLVLHVCVDVRARTLHGRQQRWVKIMQMEKHSSRNG